MMALLLLACKIAFKFKNVDQKVTLAIWDYFHWPWQSGVTYNLSI